MPASQRGMRVVIYGAGDVAATILGRRGTYTIRPEKIHLVDAAVLAVTGFIATKLTPPPTIPGVAPKSDAIEGQE